jgi:photosystem II stability/assembly factor-like uncharacterized protein
MRKIILIGKVLLLVFIVTACSQSQSNKLDFETEKGKLPEEVLSIGLSVCEDGTIWISGTNATIMRSTDGGENWESFHYEKADTLQFRDISAIRKDSVVILSAGEGPASQILSFSINSGWSQQFQMENAAGFLDAIEHWENDKAIAYGDSFDSLLYLLQYDQQLSKWNRMINLPSALDNEGGFASSGTNIATYGKGEAIIGTGAASEARLLSTKDYGESWGVETTPMINGDFAGITSVRIGKKYQLIVGGNLADTSNQAKKVYIREKSESEWEALPIDYSKGAYYGGDLLEHENSFKVIACGPHGADLYDSRSKKWFRVSEDEYWSCKFIKPDLALFLGREGNLLRLKLN